MEISEYFEMGLRLLVVVWAGIVLTVVILRCTERRDY